MNAGTVTASSTSMLNDGAAYLMLMTTKKAVTDRMWGCGGSGTERLLKCSIECGVAGTAIATNTSMLNDGAA